MPAEKKIAISDLKPGMYISRLDRPWVETPFMFQGFIISDSNDIETLTQHCEYVYIDIEKGDDSAKASSSRSATSEKKILDLLKTPVGHQVYPVTVKLEDERQVAQANYDKLIDTLSNTLDDLRTGKIVDLDKTKQALDGMVASIIRNPDAFMWLTRLKNKDAYAYAHAIDNSALAANFGRHLGLPRDEIRSLALSTLLLDIGKVKLPSEMLAKPGRLTEAEFKLMRRHVQYSLELLSEMRGISKEVLKTVATHHERHNGSGYPRKLKGTQIPVYGRIAAIVDCYDAITSDRTYAKALSQHEAIKHLYEWRDRDFQGEMVEQFIQCLGVYPTGSLVELSSGEVAIVLAQNPVRRLKPTVMIILDKNKVALGAYPRIDLVNQSTNDPIEILRPLEPGSYGIDPNEYYI